MSNRTMVVAVPVETGEAELSFAGRDAWALRELLRSGAEGCTPIENPAPRWSGYVHKLRRAGLTIETLHERHGGPFPGVHARYVLRSAVRVVRDGALA
jgi:hypothetical protein